MFLHREPVKKPVLLLNTSYEVLGRISFNDAVTKIVMDKAWVFESLDEQFVKGPPTPDGGRKMIPWPVCIVLNEYVSIPYDEITPLDDVMAARMAILNRDNWKCGYCGEVGTTFDHVYPKSRGGENTWENLICCCVDCNGFKANRTPEEAGMTLLWQPYVPKSDRYAKEQNRIWKMLTTNELVNMDEDQ